MNMELLEKFQGGGSSAHRYRSAVQRTNLFLGEDAAEKYDEARGNDGRERDEEESKTSTVRAGFELTSG